MKQNVLQLTGLSRPICIPSLIFVYILITSIIRGIKSRRKIWAYYVPRIWAMKNAYKIIVDKDTNGGSVRQWQDNIKVDIKEIAC